MFKNESIYIYIYIIFSCSFTCFFKEGSRAFKYVVIHLACFDCLLDMFTTFTREIEKHKLPTSNRNVARNAC